MSNYSESHFDESSANTSWYKAFHLIPSGSVVLDVGCSTGNFGEALIKFRNCTVDGIEIAADDVKEAKTKLREVYVLNIERDKLDVVAAKYDIAYFGDVIEHLVDPAGALKKVKSVLKDEGRVIFSIPNMAHIGVRLELLRGHFDYTETGLLDKTHLHYYDRAEVERVFSEAGFAIDELDYVEKDYPRDVIDAELAKAGLAANDTFYEQMSLPEAAAFQWVGTARPAAGLTTKRLAQFGPVDHFEKHLTQREQDFAQERADYIAKLDHLTAENNRLVHTIEDARRHPVRFGLKHFKHKVLGR